MLDQAWASWNTSLGRACFLACALDTFLDEHTLELSTAESPISAHPATPTV
jgi:hypothetical protein